MRDEFSSSVVKHSVDRKTAVDALAAWAAQLVAEHPEVEGVGYFGSYATDRYGPASDLDVVLVLRSSSVARIWDRIPDYSPRRFPLGVQVFPYTRSEVEKMLASGSRWMSHLLSEVVWVIDPGPMGPAMKCDA